MQEIIYYQIDLNYQNVTERKSHNAAARIWTSCPHICHLNFDILFMNPKPWYLHYERHPEY